MKLIRMRLKDCATVYLSNIDKHTLDNQTPVLLCNYTDVYKNKYVTRDMDFMKASATDAQIKKLTLRVNDVIITKDSESSYDIAISAVVKSVLPSLVCGYHLSLIRPTHINGDYLNYIFTSKVAKDYALYTCTGFTRVSLGKADIENFVFDSPSLQEQISIANFLDLHTAKIDRDVSLLEQKVERLEEYRQALIYETVTRGLNPDVKMKASGVDWIGDIPDHWEVKRLKDFLTSLAKSNMPSGEGDDSGVYDFYVSGSKIKKTNKLNLHRTSLLLPTGGTYMVHFTEIVPCAYSTDVLALIANSSLVIKYGFYFLISNCDYFNQLYFKGTGLKHLQRDTFLSSSITVPDKKEQTAIANYLDSATSKIDKKVALIKQKIALLKEYKQSLIYEAVTGKIDVTAQAL